MKKKYTLILIAFIFSLNANNQIVFSNNSDTLHIDPQAIIYVEGDFVNQTNGEVNNYGTIHMSGDWSNNAPNDVFYPFSTGLVRMYGASMQNITGLNPTKFYDLLLDGGMSTKNMLINSEVKNQLDVADAELQTNDNIIFVSNASPVSVLWNSGFVASNDLGGYLSRATNSTSNYVFPVGSYSLSNIYRGVEISPQTSDSNIFAVRLAPIDPTYDYVGISATGATGGFDRAIKTTLIGEINDRFYHNISRFLGNTAANIQVNYFATDGEFESMAQWQDGINAWDRTSFNNVSSFGAANLGSPDMVSNVALNADFNHDLFALNKIAGILIPQFVSPNGDGLNDVLIIDNIEYFPNNKLEIFNRYGSLVYSKDSYDNTWGGLLKNENMPVYNYKEGSLPSGTYFYVLDLGDDNYKPYTGYIQIQK
jgi:gliding motility-associated-like protein